MKFTNHAELRSVQRAISKDELSILAGIGMEVMQKGGTAIVTIAKEEVPKWISELRVVLSFLKDAQPNKAFKGELKKKLRAVKSLIAHMQSKHLPYFVVNLEEDLVLTCGHCNNRVRRNS